MFCPCPEPIKGLLGKEGGVCPPFPVVRQTYISGHSLGDKEEICSVYALFICDLFSSSRKLRLQIEHGKFELGHVVCWPAAGRLRMRWSG